MPMYKYETIIYWSAEDGCFIAEASELAGCAADGESMVKALENLHMVMQEWIETAKMLGRDIPEPKGRLAYA